MNDLIHQAAGQRIGIAQPHAEAQYRVGDILERSRPGRGSMRQLRRPQSNEDVNARIRRARRIVRDAALPGGLSFDLDAFDKDDPWR
jgi:hypothetical protein